MSGLRLVFILTTVLPGLTAVAAAQGLGDVAACERQRREGGTVEKKGEVRTFSNDDLEDLSGQTNEDSAGTVSRPGAATVPPRSAGGESGPQTMRSGGAAALQPYEAQVELARSRIQALETRLENLQQRLNPMSTTYIYGSTGGPVGGTQADEEQQVRSQVTATEQQLEQARQALSAAEAALDQARRAPVQSATPATPARAGAPAGDALPAQRP